MYKILFTFILLFGTFTSTNAAVPSSWTNDFDSYSNGNICSTTLFSCNSATINVISTDSDTPTKSVQNASSLTSRSLTFTPGTNLSTDTNVTNNIYFLFAFKPLSTQTQRLEFTFSNGSASYIQLGLAAIADGYDSYLYSASSTFAGLVQVSNTLNYDQWNGIFVEYNKATRLTRYKINDGEWSATIFANQNTGGVTALTYKWIASGSINHKIDTIITTNTDPSPQTISRFTSASPLPQTQLTSTTTISFDLTYTSALPYVEEICIYLVGVTNPQNFIPKCTDITQSGTGLTFATTTTVTNNAIYTWHAEMYDFDGDIVDSLVQRSIAVGTNSNPNQAWDDFIASTTASSTPIDANTFCADFSFTIGAVCNFVIQIITPIQGTVNNIYISVRETVLSKVPFVYIVQINQQFRNSALEQTDQFDGIEFKLTPQSTVTVLTQTDFNDFISPVGLAIMRALIEAVIWLSVLMFFWSQRNAFKI